MSVVDASVAVKWVYGEEGTPEALDVLATETSLTAPALWRLETVNALLRKSREGRLSGEEVRRRVGYLASLPITLADDGSLTPAAITLSLELHHPVYDCLYLALALREGSRLLTADRPFFKAARRGGYAAAVQLIGPDQR